MSYSVGDKVIATGEWTLGGYVPQGDLGTVVQVHTDDTIAVRFERSGFQTVEEGEIRCWRYS